MAKTSQTPLTAQELIRRNQSLADNARADRVNSLFQKKYFPGGDFAQEALPDATNPNSFRDFTAHRRPPPKVPWGSKFVAKIKQVSSLRIPRYSGLGKNVRKVQKAVSFTTWKYQRAISKAGTKLVTKSPALTLPARMLQVIGNKIPFLAKGSAIRAFLPVLKPLARFIPIVGTALTIASIAIQLWQWGNSKLNKPKAVKPKPRTEPPPFTGGQSSGTRYQVVYSWETLEGRTLGNTAFTVWGEILGIRSRNNGEADFAWVVEILCRGTNTSIPGELRWYGDLNAQRKEHLNIRFHEITRADGQPDTGGNIGSPFNPLLTSARSVRRMLPGESPYSDYLPSGSKHQPRYSDPTPARSPLESNKRKPLLILVPAGKPVTLTTPDGNSVTVAPTNALRIITIPRPLPTQTSTSEPDPEREPAPLPIIISSPTKSPTIPGTRPTPSSSPTSKPIILTNPGSGPVTISIPGSEPYTYNSTSPKNAPLPLSTIKPIGKNQPATLKPIAIPATTPTATPSPTAPATNQDLEDLLLPLGIVGGLAGLGLLVKQIHDRTSPAELGKITEASVCRTTQPGGCSTNAMNNAANTGSQNTLNALGVGAQGAQLGILKIIDNKLGPQMTGGISGALGRFMSSSVVTRAINLATLAGVIHNVFMLSNSVQESFFQILDNLIAIPQLITDPDGATIDTKEKFTKGADSFFSSVFGATEYAALKIQWKAYSTIYNTGANMFGEVRNIVQETQEIQQTTANWVAELGNGLVNEGAIGEENWEIKDEDQKPRGKYFGRLERIREGAETVENVFEDLEQISQSARSIVETANELKANTTAIKAEISKANKAAQLDRDSKEEGIDLPNFSFDDLY